MKQEYHRLLKRQIKKYFSEDLLAANMIPEEFFDAINDAYQTFEHDYRQLDRTLEVSSDEMMVLNRDLKRMNEELDKFVYIASHDLKAPLNSMLGLIRLAKLESNNPETIDLYLDMMQKSVNKLTQTINDLTDFSRNARLSVSLEKVEVDTIINEIVDNLRFAPNADKIKINCTFDIKEQLYSDRLRLTILFNNLISNSIKYHNFRQESPYINVSIEANFDKAIFKIEDNGIGIGAEHHDKIYNMFYRATESATGTGLGLYIVKGIIEKLNGKIYFESKLGKGTIFTVEIPNHREVAAI